MRRHAKDIESCKKDTYSSCMSMRAHIHTHTYYVSTLVPYFVEKMSEYREIVAVGIMRRTMHISDEKS